MLDTGELLRESNSSDAAPSERSRASLQRARPSLRVDVNIGDPVTPAPVEVLHPTLLGEPFTRLGYLAVAANGRIVAVAEPVLVAGGPARFSFLIPPSLVRAGRNDIVVYAIGGPPSAPTLASRPMPLSR